MSEMTPFENKDAIATTQEFAEANELTTIADLGGLHGSRSGRGRSSRASTSAWRGSSRSTASPTSIRAVRAGAQYAALDNGDADAVNAFTTDPQLETGKYTLLEDPELLFGSQNVVMVVGQGQARLDRRRRVPAWSTRSTGS